MVGHRKTIAALAATLVAALLCLGAATASAAGDAKITWYDYNQGMELGKQQNKKVFLTFYADWCKYCKLMDKETFRDPKVVAFLNEKFIPVKVDADREEKLVSDFSVRGLPSNWFVNEDGEKVMIRPGYISAKELMPILEYIHSDSYKTMSFKEYLKSR